MHLSCTISRTLGLLVALALPISPVAAAADVHPHHAHNASTSTFTNSTGTATPPTKYGMLLFRAFDLLDVFGPLEVLQYLSREVQLQLYLIADGDPSDSITSQPVTAAMNPYNSSFFPTINAVYNLTTAPSDIEVLIIPGGLGVRSPALNATVAYIAAAYPSLKYLITICTGAGLAAKAGVLDGRVATTNKASWEATTAYGPNTTWVAPARWVVDGNIWSSSGVSAGIDAMLGFVAAAWRNESLADYLAEEMEYERRGMEWDPYAALNGDVTKVASG